MFSFPFNLLPYYNVFFRQRKHRQHVLLLFWLPLIVLLPFFLTDLLQMSFYISVFFSYSINQQTKIFLPSLWVMCFILNELNKKKWTKKKLKQSKGSRLLRSKTNPTRVCYYSYTVQFAIEVDGRPSLQI